MIVTNLVALFAIFFIGYSANVEASGGDEAIAFRNCLALCIDRNCTNVELFHEQQSLMHKLLLWSCFDECEYHCMWSMVDRDLKFNKRIQQYHGKWPFVRVFGVQEPASAIFSVLNGLAHIVAFRRFQQKVPSTAPMFNVYRYYTFHALITWTFSTIFHSRDTNITERLDYIFATSLVLCNIWIVCVRLHGTRQLWRPVSSAAVAVFFFTQHAYYLAMSPRFDYRYNMIANATVGVINISAWLFYCFWVRSHQPYVWKGLTTFITTIVLFVVLELQDFPPVLWTFDAHSLWHAATIPLIFLLYSFATDDCLYLAKQKDGFVPSLGELPLKMKPT